MSDLYWILTLFKLKWLFRRLKNVMNILIVLLNFEIQKKWWAVQGGAKRISVLFLLQWLPIKHSGVRLFSVTHTPFMQSCVCNRLPYGCPMNMPPAVKAYGFLVDTKMQYRYFPIHPVYQKIWRLFVRIKQNLSLISIFLIVTVTHICDFVVL